MICEDTKCYLGPNNSSILLVDLTVFWFMLPVCIGIATLAMLTGIGGTAMLTPLLILGFPLLGVPILTPAEAVGMALLTEFFGFTSGLIGYHRARLIDYNVGKNYWSYPYLLSLSSR